MTKAYRPGQNTLTNNFSANMWILGTGAVGYVLAMAFGFFPWVAGDHLPGRELVAFVACFLLTSLWFSPDLDVRENRPGKYTFPFGHLKRLFSWMKRSLPLLRWPLEVVMIVIEPLHLVLNRVWFLLWDPFALLFTHRGAVHWPFVGTQLKIIWLYLAYWLASTPVAALLPGLTLPLAAQTPWEGLFGPGGLYEAITSSPEASSGWVGAMLADVAHAGIDAWDSWKKGSSFVPPANIAPRGLLVRIVASLASALRWLSGRLLG